VPILFNFPNAGRLLTLLFVPFAAWLAGSAFSAADYSTLFAVGIPSYLAKAQVALPFLMDVFGLPHDLFQLYVPLARRPIRAGVLSTRRPYNIGTPSFVYLRR